MNQAVTVILRDAIHVTSNHTDSQANDAKERKRLVFVYSQLICTSCGHPITMADYKSYTLSLTNIKGIET